MMDHVSRSHDSIIIIRYPVKLCNPAPTVDKRAPIRISHLVGHANSATTNPPIASPNLSTNQIVAILITTETTY